MFAVFKHELRSYFHSFSTYLFCAFLLEFVGIGTVLYNIQSAIANFEYVLNFVGLGMAIIVPVLTMRVMAEERKQGTDMLLYSLPLKPHQIILGKYFALLLVFAIPMVVIAFYPPIFSMYGDVYLPTAYGSLFAFFIMNAALIAIGMFVSSLTDSVALAAGITIPILVLNYYMVTLASVVSTTAIGAFIALLVCVAVLALIAWLLTKDQRFTAGVAIVGFLAVGIFALVDYSALEGLLPAIMEQLSLFDRFANFVNGSFDLRAIVFYLSVIIFFLFLSGESMEKRRYN